MTIPAFHNLQHKDTILLLLATLLNPLLYAMKSTAGGLMPDSPAYILLGNQLIGHGNLFLAGWGHIDTGLILPPLYPALIGLFNLAIDDGIYNAQLISTLSLLLSSIPLYLLIKRSSTTIIAFFSVLIFQLNFHYFFFGTTVLAEAVFILLLLILLTLTQNYVSNREKTIAYPLIIGILTALLFFSRHIGIFYLAAFPLLLLPGLIARHKKIWVGLILFFAGFLILFTPYSIALKSQSSNGPFTQHFRMHQYIVEANDQSVKARPTNYSDIYQQRREQRHLSADGSEMLGYLVTPSSKAKGFALPTFSRYFNNLVNNLSNLVKVQGAWIVILFTLISLNSFYQAWKQQNVIRILIPICVITYLLTLSLVTGLVERYTIILFPLFTTHIMIETGLLLNSYFEGRPASLLPKLITPLLALVLIFLTPDLFTKAKTFPRLSENKTPITHCKTIIDSGAPIFSINSMGAYLLGGIYRALPNDNLDRIANYANLTGVKWMFLRQSELDTSESKYYVHARWLQGSLAPDRVSNRYKLRCKSLYGDAQVYEISNQTTPPLHSE
jgi:4-amino-4-deoxy-L-arabinose transferase-like glycosyltransferase